MFDYKSEAEINRYRQMLRIEAGRAALDRINGQTKQVRRDGYVNLLNKYGTAQDNSTAYSFAPEGPVSDVDLTTMYQDGGLFSKIIDAPAEEAVKKGFDTGVTDEKAKEYIEDTMAWLEWDENISTALKWSRLYGGAIAVMMIDDGRGLDEPLDLGAIRSIEELRVYDRSIAIPDYNSIYRLEPTVGQGPNRYRHRYLEPEFYDVSSIYGSFRVHESRCLVFRNGKMPERSTMTQYRHWGIPEYIRIRKELREAVTAPSYSVKMLEKCVQAIYGMKNLAELLSTDEGEDIVLKRLQVIDMARNFLNSIAIDADGESYDFKSMSLAGVKDIVETTFATISAVTNIPQTILFGRSPAGENATGEGDMENWYSYVERNQKVQVVPNLKYLLDITIKAGMAQGYISEDPKPKLTMNPLWSLSEAEQANVDQVKANTAQVKAATAQMYVDMQVIGPDEVRRGLAKEGEFDIDTLLDDEPEDEGWGLDPASIGYDPASMTYSGNPQGRPSEAQGTSQTGWTDPGTTQQTTGADGDLSPGHGNGKLNGAGVIVVKNGMVLVGRRKSDFCPGTICGPGGHIEPGETSRQAAAREAREEFGITIDPADLILLGVDDTLPSEFGGTAFYLTTKFTGDPACDGEEMTGAQFADASELIERPEGLFPPFTSSLKLLEKVLTNGENSDGADFSCGSKIDGGPGSGNFGHEGRPGEVGGSSPDANSLNDSLSSSLRKGGAEFTKKAKEIVESVPVGTEFEQFGEVFKKIEHDKCESAYDGIISTDRVLDQCFPDHISESMLPKFRDIGSEDIAASKIESGELEPSETSVSGKGVAISKYQDYGYQDVNGALRRGEKLEGEAAEIDKGLQEAFRDANPTVRAQTLYRDSGFSVTSKAFEETGLGEYLAENFSGSNLMEAWYDPGIRQTIRSSLIGYEFEEPGYSSTTKSREFLNQFSAGQGGLLSISEHGAKESMVINVPAGSRVLDLGEDGMISGSGENETIINKGAKYRIADVYLDMEAGGLGLVCDYLPDNGESKN